MAYLQRNHFWRNIYEILTIEMPLMLFGWHGEIGTTPIISSWRRLVFARGLAQWRGRRTVI